MARFKDIYDLFVAGEKIRLSDWSLQEYIYLKDGVIKTDSDGGWYRFNGMDLTRTDWVVYLPTTPTYSDELVFAHRLAYRSRSCDCGKEKHGFMAHVSGCPAIGRDE